MMIQQSIWTSCLAAKIAAQYLNEGGLLVLTGAKAALSPTPGIVTLLFTLQFVSKLFVP